MLIINLTLLFFLNYKLRSQKGYYEKALSLSSDFNLLSPDIAAMEIDDFLNIQKTLMVSYWNLKLEIYNILNNTRGIYGIYIEDLTTGAWIGINEREQFYPASLVKVPYLVASLKKIERGEMNLNSTFILSKEDLDRDSGDLYKKGENYNITAIELLAYLVKKSDNTAFSVLLRQIADTEIGEAVYSMGVYPTNDTNQDTEKISPKQYSNIFRSLYYSTYLKRPFSQLALSLMEDTIYNSQIKSGLPENIKFSHKVGINNPYSAFHDCGIVYVPHKPYMICIMSTNTTWEESRETMARISNTAYNYMLASLDN